MFLWMFLCFTFVLFQTVQRRNEHLVYMLIVPVKAELTDSQEETDTQRNTNGGKASETDINPKEGSDTFMYTASETSKSSCLTLDLI